MKKLTLILLLVIFCFSLSFAEKLKLAVLKYENTDMPSKYFLTKAGIGYDYKTILKDNENVELMKQKDVDKIVKKSGKHSLFNESDDVVYEIGMQTGADIITWGRISQGEGDLYAVNTKIMDLGSKQVKSVVMQIPKNRKERKPIVEEKLIKVIEEFKSSAISNQMAFAQQQFKSGDFAGAEESFRKVLKFDDKNYEAISGLAFTVFKAKRYDDALVLYDEALVKFPDDKQLILSKSNVYYEKGDYEASTEILESYVETLEEGQADVWFSIGNIYKEGDLTEEAIEAYEKAIEYDGEMLKAHKIIGEILYDQEEYEDASEYLLAASEAFPDDETLSNKVAISLRKSGNLEVAIEQYQKLIEQDPANEKNYIKLSKLFLQIGVSDNDTEKLNKAIGVLNKLLEKNPESFDGNNLIASAYISTKKLSQAEKFAKKAENIDPFNPEPNKTLAKISESRGYTKFNLYAAKIKEAEGKVGEELERIMNERDEAQKAANNYFINAKSETQKAIDKTESASEINSLRASIQNLNKLINDSKPEEW